MRVSWTTAVLYKSANIQHHELIQRYGSCKQMLEVFFSSTFVTGGNIYIMPEQKWFAEVLLTFLAEVMTEGKCFFGLFSNWNSPQVLKFNSLIESHIHIWNLRTSAGDYSAVDHVNDLVCLEIAPYYKYTVCMYTH